MIFRPKIPITNNAENNIFCTDTLSFRNKIPKMIVPTAPIPVNTVYAAPVG